MAAEVELVRMEQGAGHHLAKEPPVWRPPLRSPGRAAALSCLCPGLGQWYSYRVAAALLVLLLWLSLVLCVVAPCVVLACSSLAVAAGRAAVQGAGDAAAWALGTAQAQSDVAEALPLLSSATAAVGEAAAAAHTEAGTVLQEGSRFVPEALDGPLALLRSCAAAVTLAVTSFPLPPLSYAAVTLLTAAYGMGGWLLALLALSSACFYVLQAFHAYQCAVEVNRRPETVQHPRLIQLVSLLATTVLPYILVLLPIPGSTEIVALCFCSNETIAALLESVRTSTLPPSVIVTRHIKAVAMTMVYQFVVYSLLLLAAIVYAGVYAVRILLWAAWLCTMPWL